jgi:hypothetical protein
MIMTSLFATLRRSRRSSCNGRSRRAHRPRARLALEPLEGRPLLSIAFAPPVAIDVGGFPFSVASGDFNQDGASDLAVANGGGVPVLMNDGSGSFPSGLRQQLLANLPGWEGYTSSVTAGDLNHDGYPDLVVGRQVIGDVAVLLYNPQTGSFDPPTFYDAGPGFTYVGNNLAIGDLNGDGFPDLAVANIAPANVAVLLNDGTGHFPGQPYLFAGGGAVSEADLNGDGKLDLVVGAGNGSDSVSVLLNQSPLDHSSVAFGAPIDLDVGPDITSFAVADLNGDTRPDVVVATTSPYDLSSTVRVLVNNGNGSFAPAAVDPVYNGFNAKSVTTGDFDGNGTIDLAVFATVYHTEQVPSPNPDDPPGTLVTIQVPNDVVSVLPNNGDATFGSPTDLEISDSDSSAGNIIAADLNNDGTTDLITANNHTGTITVFYNPKPASTPAGSNVDIQPTDPVTGTSPMEITFSSVTEAGGTTVTSSATNGPPPPADFALPDLATPIYYDVQTTAGFSGSAEVCIQYSPAGVSDESALRLFHYQNGSWTDVTTSLDTATHTICGIVSSFSPFAIFEAAPRATLSGMVFEDFNDDGQVDFGEQGIAGVTISLTGTDDLGSPVALSQTTDADGTYVFGNLRPGSYTITEAQPAGYTQGINTVGTAGGTVVGDQFSITGLGIGIDGLNYNFGERPAATGPITKGQTAGIGFWNNKNGQALIKALNGGVGTQLGDWLARTFPHMFGQDSGSNNLAGQNNASIASFFQSRFVVHGQKLDAQVLATALAVYVTDPTLDSTGVGTQYGFVVGGNGVATATYNVGSNGAAFGVADNTTMTMMDLLLAADAQAVNGVLYNGNTTRRNLANTVFSAINEAGGL